VYIPIRKYWNIFRFFPISNDQKIIQMIGMKGIVIAYPLGGNIVEEIDIDNTIRKKGKYLIKLFFSNKLITFIF
tara:strand:- start:200 stop:421 length:222 start_codon:yes stop_codon:yes gene_type:complete